MNATIATLLSVIGVSFVSLIGVATLALRQKFLHKILHVLVSFAVGALLGDALIHLLPGAFEKVEKNLTTSLYTMAGVLIFFLLEKIVAWHRSHNLETVHPSHHIGVLNLIGDGLHNFIDGLLIAASYLVSIPLGIATTLAVILHEIPQEIGDFAILIHSGFSAQRAVLYNFLSALTAVAGAIVGLIVGGYLENFSTAMLAVTAGAFIYIAASDLIPELHKEDKPLVSLLEILGIIAGVAVMALLTLVE
ncbi:ZIP family metal transporter [Candidatus Berkelbacteria bacterium]|nr:ZIP family metal transporter [Candidatus Berkelbacteria bacterium]